MSTVAAIVSEIYAKQGVQVRPPLRFEINLMYGLGGDAVLGRRTHRCRTS